MCKTWGRSYESSVDITEQIVGGSRCWQCVEKEGRP